MLLFNIQFNLYIYIYIYIYIYTYMHIDNYHILHIKTMETLLNSLYNVASVYNYISLST